MIAFGRIATTLSCFLVYGLVPSASAQPVVCGDGVIQAGEECDPPTPGQPPGATLCNLNCLYPDCGDWVAGDCCDPTGHDNPRCGQCSPDPAGSAQACCEEVCWLDSLCCDTDGGQWDDACAALANDVCSAVGECCNSFKGIATCAEPYDTEGCLKVCPDEWGAMFYIISFGGNKCNHDVYNPPGVVAAGPVTFTNGFMLNVGTDRREALSDPTDNWHGLLNDGSCNTAATLSPIVTWDTNGDATADTAMSAFNVTCTGVDLSFDVVSHVEALTVGSGAALLEQNYTVTNNSTAPISFTLLRHADFQLLWDPDYDWTDDSVGTGMHGCGLGTFVWQKDVGVPGAVVTLSSPQATRYYASKKSLRPPNFSLSGDQEVPPVTSAGNGTGTLTLDTLTDPANPTLSWNVLYEDLTSPGIAALFHGPALPGANAPPIWSVLLTLIPSGDGTSGTITDSQVITPIQAEEIIAGKWYLNVHTSLNTIGEIRGQVPPSYGYGTDLQQWDHRGVPNGWGNYIPNVGYGMNGESGDLQSDPLCDPCDAAVGLEIPVSLEAGASTAITLYVTYGADTPLAQECPCGVSCLGDFNADGMVNSLDLALTLGNWGVGCDQTSGCCMDVSSDGRVNALDLALLLGNWGPC